MSILNFYSFAIEAMERFGIGKERDEQSMEHTFSQWKETSNLQVKQGRRHLGKDLARVLDGESIQALVEARKEAVRDPVGRAQTPEAPPRSPHLRHSPVLLPVSHALKQFNSSLLHMRRMITRTGTMFQ